LGKIEVEEQVFAQGRRGPEIRPFSESAEVQCRGCSEALQRALTDFGADEPFAGAAVKLREPYGIEVPVSTLRAVTERHGEAMGAQATPPREWPDHPGVEVLIAEMDGSMVPVVTTAEPGVGEVRDRRKTRKVGWKEARLCLVRRPESVRPILGGTMGSVEEAGAQLRECALKAGAGSQTKIHAVGDAAAWITDQVELQFGTQAEYLVDLYHLCGYLAAAGAVVAPANPNWMQEKRDGLKENRWPEVLESLRPYLEKESVADAEAPVHACHRYLSNHSPFLDDRGALAAGLPMGSGEIESAHRYILQKRVKISGAWWKLENLSKMLALRLLRANGGWEEYWEKAA
jgi:Uncharacterised protein family (UPF0236)